MGYVASVSFGKDSLAIKLKNNENFNTSEENVKLRPRFRKCKELGCDKMYNCQEKIETHFTNSGWTMDYFCKRKNTFVYWE